MYKIWYTTWVFDMFHIWHLNLLIKAKELCDYLIVWVLTDELVFKRKNKNAVINFDERFEILSHIDVVDKVVSQDVVDEVLDFHKYGYNVIIKWSDWRDTEKWNNLEKELKKLWSSVHFVEYTKWISSTKLREKIIKWE